MYQRLLILKRTIASFSSNRMCMAGTGSTPRVKLARDRFLNAPLEIDVEYIHLYKTIHQSMVGTLNSTALRAECHAHALENITPVIREGELLVGSKTRFVRGAIPCCHLLKEDRIRIANVHTSVSGTCCHRSAVITRGFNSRSHGHIQNWWPLT